MFSFFNSQEKKKKDSDNKLLTIEEDLDSSPIPLNDKKIVDSISPQERDVIFNFLTIETLQNEG